MHIATTEYIATYFTKFFQCQYLFLSFKYDGMFFAMKTQIQHPETIIFLSTSHKSQVVLQLRPCSDTPIHIWPPYISLIYFISGSVFKKKPMVSFSYLPFRFDTNDSAFHSLSLYLCPASFTFYCSFTSNKSERTIH